MSLLLDSMRVYRHLVEGDRMPKNETPEQAEERRRKARERHNERYATDPEFREKVKAKALSAQARRRRENPEAERENDRLRMARWRAENPEQYRESRRRGSVAARKRAQDHVNAIKASTPCTDCGNFYPPVCMDFDHIADDKQDNVGSLVARGHAIERIDSEIAKCEVVCSNCHRIRTRERHMSKTEAAS